MRKRSSLSSALIWCRTLSNDSESCEKAISFRFSVGGVAAMPWDCSQPWAACSRISGGREWIGLRAGFVAVIFALGMGIIPLRAAGPHRQER